ncbi:MAG: bifunctional aldolase/short-chain dehydrogenase [Egibacteraceae bacterium]
MENRWSDADAVEGQGVLGACVYGSRLIGSEPTLVLHGGGNTSTKTTVTDVTGRLVEVLYVKGSGWDLATIEAAGFPALRMERLRELLTLQRLSDRQMMNELRAALLDAAAPDPSVETLLHAALPHPAVQHSHADALLTVTNLKNGAAVVREIYGDRVVVVPYVMPGFDLARTCAVAFPLQWHADTVGVVLMNHGLFTFGEDTKQAYTRHIQLVTEAEEYLRDHAPMSATRPPPAVAVPPVELARIRRDIASLAGRPMIVTRHTDDATRAFVARPDLAAIARRGPATPDHVIRTKRTPLVGRDLAGYAEAYRSYFAEHAHRARESLTMLDPAPRVVLDPELGMLTVGLRAKDADIARDIYAHTMQIIQHGEALGGYHALPAADIFDVEYWELEQAKLRRGGQPAEFSGEVAVVTGAASGIGRACAEALLAGAASVVGLDVNPAVTDEFEGHEYLGQCVDVTDAAAVKDAVGRGVERFGGIDIVVPSAGIFPASMPVGALDWDAWRRTMAVNTDAVAVLLRDTYPLLKESPRGGRVVIIASKNVPAPGRGAAPYSVSKAAVTQLARVAALEWAADRIRVNVVHPDAVFDTGLWTEELLAQRARHYDLSVEQYKRRNLLHTEITSAAVGRLVATLCSDAFAGTTGAQIPIDGGNERVI